MFKEKEYQVKDIMDMYGVSRDTIKYYENHGLIESYRKENGYRHFDEMNVRKLKKILALRDVGMTVEETLKHCNSNSIEERSEVVTEVRLRIVQEIRELNMKLNKIHDLERNVSENFRFSSGFNAGKELTLCVNCPHLDVNDQRSFNVISALQLEYSREKGMENIQDCTLIRNKSLEKTCCANCKLSKSYSTHYRYRIHYKSKEQVEELLYNAYADLRMQGYQPCKIIYMMKKVIRKNGEDIMILDTLLPLED